MEATRSSEQNVPVKKRILVVDDHPVLRRGVGSILEREKDFEVCAEAGNAAEALDALRKFHPNAAVIDISLPGTDGIELIKLMKRVDPKLKILVLSMQDECEFGIPALRAGADGYMMKDDTVNDLVKSVRRILDDVLCISPELKRRLLAFAPDVPLRENTAPETVTEAQFEEALHEQASAAIHHRTTH